MGLKRYSLTRLPIVLYFFLLMSVPLAAAPRQSAIDARNIFLVPAEQVPTVRGTFWTAQTLPPLPYNPYPDLPLYSLGGNNFLIDDREVDHLAEQIQARGGMMSLQNTPAPPTPEGGGTNSASGASGGHVNTTNDLWLDITFQIPELYAFINVNMPSEGSTNAWMSTNTYDLYFAPNLQGPQAWTRVARCYPWRTNYMVGTLPCATEFSTADLPASLGFFRLGSTTNAVRPGLFTNFFLPPNDDNTIGDVKGGGPLVSNLLANIGFSIKFYSNYWTNVYVNNNGNITFGHHFSPFVPLASLVDIGEQIIAPFWADIDTRAPESDLVRYGTNTVDGHRAFGVNWGNVGYYAWNTDRLLNCQLVIISRSDIAAGDFDLEFNYDRIEWVFSDSSGDNAPRAGFSDGYRGYELPGSGGWESFLDSYLNTSLIYHSMNSPVSGRYLFQFRGGFPNNLPSASQPN